MFLKKRNFISKIKRSKVTDYAALSRTNYHPHVTNVYNVSVEQALFEEIRSYFVLFDLILYVHSTVFQLCGTGLPGLNQY